MDVLYILGAVAGLGLYWAFAALRRLGRRVAYLVPALCATLAAAPLVTGDRAAGADLSGASMTLLIFWLVGSTVFADAPGHPTER